jgi:polyphosphate kinase
VEDPGLRHFVRAHLLEMYLRDNVNSRVLEADGNYRRVVPGEDEEIIDSQAIHMGYHTHTVATM